MAPKKKPKPSLLDQLHGTTAIPAGIAAPAPGSPGLATPVEAQAQGAQARAIAATRSTPLTVTTTTTKPKGGQSASDKAAQAIKDAAANTKASTASIRKGAVQGSGGAGAAAGKQPLTTLGFSYGLENPSADPAKQAPVYYQGDEWNIGRTLPASDPVNGGVLELQQKLLDAHYLTTAQVKNVTPGVFSGETVTAFQKLLTDANGQGVSWEDLLTNETSAADTAGGIGSSGSGSGSGGGGGKVQSVTLPDPSQIASAANTAAQRIIGRNLSTAENSSIQSQINALVNAKAAEQIARDPDLPPINVDINTEVEKMIRAGQPGQSAVHDTLGALDMFNSLLGPGGKSFTAGSFGNSQVGIGA